MKYFSGEELKLNELKNGTTQKVSFSEISKKYYEGQVRIVTEQARYPLNTIVALVDSKNYILRPGFQRRHRWDNKRKSKLIESFIINVPIPPVFLYETSYSKYEVMDGLQRITAIYEYYNDVFELEGLEEWKELNGLKYSQLPEVVRLGIDRRYLSSIILLQETAKDYDQAMTMKQLVFERLNSGGVDLSDQETRNALYDGKLNQLCMELSKNVHFRKLFNIQLNIDDVNSATENSMYDKMEDVELVLRFFAFRQIEKWDSSYIKKFLDQYLILGNNMPESTLKELSNCFLDTIEIIHSVFGGAAFKLWRKTKGSDVLKQASKPTKVLYDPLMLSFCQFIDKKDILMEKKEVICNELKKLFEEQPDLFISRFNKNDIIQRRDEITKMIQKIIGE